MSGRKKSSIELEREREDRLKLINSVNAARARLKGLSLQIQTVLDKTPKGIKEAFPEEIEESIQWLDNAKMGRQDTEFDMWSSDSDINSSLSELGIKEGQCRRILDNITNSLNYKASALEKSLNVRLNQLESRYYGYRDSLGVWFGDETLNTYEDTISSAKGHLNSHSITETQNALEDFEQFLNTKVSIAQELEEKHQKRLYVLKALRQVCSEMGFEETEPKYENDGKRGRIVYEVDTVDQGIVSFFLSLDGVSADSCILDDKCLDEFDNLSELLQNEFGVKTKFSVEDSRSDGTLLRKGELDLPDGAGLTLEQPA